MDGRRLLRWRQDGVEGWLDGRGVTFWHGGVCGGRSSIIVDDDVVKEGVEG
jgi:hypothetical protein